MESSKDIVRRIYELVDAGNLDAVEALLSTDAVAHTAGRTLDRDGIRQALANDVTFLPNLQTTVEALVAEGDLVVARITMRGTHTGVLRSLSGLEVAPTGKRVTTTGLVMFHIRDGLVVEMWEELDRLSMLRQIGAVGRPAD